MQNYVDNFFSGIYGILVESIRRVVGIGINQLTNSDKIFITVVSLVIGFIILFYIVKFVWGLFRL